MNTTTTNSAEAFAKDIILRILREITLHPQHIKLTESPLGRTTTIKIQVNRGDMPRVIGSKGAHAMALETLVGIIGRRQNALLKTRVIEPEVGEQDRFSKFAPREEWDKQKVQDLMTDIVESIFQYPVRVEVMDGEEYQSVCEVFVSQGENKELVQTVNAALNPLFVAIGKANGRLLTVNVAPGE